ncbi:hypothetical protein RDI61_16545 [Pseudomonas plecoglossicida]|uniref:hypothetical protein n=1 Tax=Pseudomonas putida group TaxID=136845 RepID=UPI002410B0E1|nr:MULTISPECIES: hypothetical protein [Pseudomonas putida group]MDQ7965634.1 hypothetical protein [Pseudomonas plecoglossicida]WFG04470.1 hypothetical protein P3X84_07565 [Pseudomonas putida]
MSHPKNSKPRVAVQQPKESLSDLRSRFRAAHGAYGIARVLLEDQAQLGEMLLPRDREGLVSALEFCTQALYAHHEYAYHDAPLHAAEQGGTQ